MKTKFLFSRRARGFLLLVGLGLAGAVASAKPVNVLFIAIDDLRPELATYGAGEVQTPHIDRLAGKGVKFNSAYCQYPVCNPSRSSFLSGLRPNELGILSNKIPLREKYPELVTLPQAFRNNGYYTAGLGKLLHMGLDDEGEHTFFQDNASFDYFYSARRKTPEIGSQGEGRKLGDGTVGWAQWLAAEGGDEAQMDGLLAAEAVRVLEENHDKPFFIGVGFHKPHDPFFAPKEYFDLYPLEDIKLNEDPADRTPMLRYATPGNYNFETYTDKDRREFKRAYLACTSFVDAQVGKLLDTMDRLDLWENTIVVLLGDHGYHLGEHGWWNKVTLFDIGARTPLIIWVPGSEQNGKPSEAVVELLDLYPTLMDFAGLPAPHAMSGKSLRPVLQNTALRWNDPAFTQVTRGEVKMGYSVRQGEWRLTQWGAEGQGGYELYKVTTDREGYYNFAENPEYASVRARLQLLLKENYAELN